MEISNVNPVSPQPPSDNEGPKAPSGDTQAASLLLNVGEALTTVLKNDSGDTLAKIKEEMSDVEQKLKNPNLTLQEKEQLMMQLQDLSMQYNNALIAQQGKELQKLSQELKNPNLTPEERSQIESEMSVLQSKINFESSQMK